MKRNIAARLGGWSARHRKAAIGGWLLFVVAASVIGALSGQVTLKDYEQGAGDSARAQRILADAGITRPASEMVLVHSDVPDGWHAAAGAVAARVGGTGRVENLAPPLVSADRRDALVRFDMAGDPHAAGDAVPAVLDAVASVRTAYPHVSIDEFGDASAEKWFNDRLGKDFGKAEWTAVPVALGILLVAFAALMAAVLPVALALTAFVAANGLLALVSHGMHVDSTTNSVMLLMGLAVGVDYSLFYLRRERDERAAGRDRHSALQIAAATAGRSVLVSGVTVILAMSAMFLSGLALFRGFALATVLVVCIAMIGSVTVLPAMLSLLGDKVELGRIPLMRPRRSGRLAGAVLRPVLARPGVFAAAAVGLLLALAAPATGMHTEKLGIDKRVNQDTPILTGYQKISAAFPGGPAPAQVVVQAPAIRAPEVARAIAGFKAAVAGSREFGTPVTVTTYPAKNIAVIDVPLAGAGADPVSRHALDTLRGQVIPSTLGRVAAAYVTGQLAFDVDFNAQLGQDFLPVFVSVLALTFLLILISFRSVTIAIMSIVLNLLSIAATYGVIVAVFQRGWGAHLVGTRGVGAIESWVPLFVFVVLFGLSMDYHVFVVSRIREARESGLTTTAAIRYGVRATAGVVSSAAIIMVAVFAVFATLSMQDFKQLGVGLAVAVLLDATLVRVLLLPALMCLLGERNWYLPRWLYRLPGRGPVSQPRPQAQPLAPVPTAAHDPVC